MACVIKEIMFMCVKMNSRLKEKGIFLSIEGFYIDNSNRTWGEYN